MLGLTVLKRWIPLLLIFSLLLIFFYFDLGRLLSFSSLKNHRHQLIEWTNEHYLLAVLTYMSIYAVAVIASIPGATFFTLAGGFLFGIVLGSIYVILSATIGATVIFWAVRYALEPFIRRKASGWIAKMRDGFNEGAFQYLLFLRLVPIFPFWVVNIVPAIFGMPTSAYVLATFLGIIPGSIVYVTLGNGLGHIFDQDKTPDLSIIFDPAIFFPLLGLGFLSLLPIVFKKMRGNHEKKTNI